MKLCHRVTLLSLAAWIVARCIAAPASQRVSLLMNGGFEQGTGVAAAGADSLEFHLIEGHSRVVETWKHLPAGVIGLPLPRPYLPECDYHLEVEARDRAGQILASAGTPLMLTESPWEAAPRDARRTAADGGAGGSPRRDL